ncbi:MAG: hypothetical protein AAF616_09075 [Bacteroidota bacterium]
MDLQANKRTLGIVHIVYGALTALVFVFIGAFISILEPFIMEAIEDEGSAEGLMVFDLVASIIRIVFAFIFILSALPSIIGGIGLVQQKSWGMVVSLIAGCLAILSFPFGTILGIYSIYVFVQHNKQKENEQDPG